MKVKIADIKNIVISAEAHSEQVLLNEFLKHRDNKDYKFQIHGSCWKCDDGGLPNSFNFGFTKICKHFNIEKCGEGRYRCKDCYLSYDCIKKYPSNDPTIEKVELVETDSYDFKEKEIKPSLGITPRSIIAETRRQEILDGMSRFNKRGYAIPDTWIYELNELEIYLWGGKR